MSRQTLVLAVHNSFPSSRWAEFVAARRRGPAELCHLGRRLQPAHSAEWFAKTAGIKLEHVPYRGAGQAVNDLIAGHGLDRLPGADRAVARTTRPERCDSPRKSSRGARPKLAGSTNARGGGFKDVVLESWYGAFVPAGTPTAVIAYLNGRDGQGHGGIRRPATAELQTATEPVGGSAEEFGRVVRADSAKYARLAKELSIRIN